MTRFSAAIVFALFATISTIAYCDPEPAATPAPADSVVPTSKIQPAKLLNYTYTRWQAVTASQYGCENSSVVAADSYTKAEDGVIKERWQTRMCNFGKNVWVILTPDGNGGYIVAFGQ